MHILRSFHGPFSANDKSTLEVAVNLVASPYQLTDMEQIELKFALSIARNPRIPC